MRDPNRRLRWVSIVLFPLLIALFAAIYRSDPYRYLDLLREDYVVEWATFAGFAIAGLLALDICLRIWKQSHTFQWFYAAFGLFCLLLALEEISWGQRVFGFQSAEIFLSNSDQQEVNFHNLLQQQFDFETKDLGGLILFIYGAILPILAYNRWVAALFRRMRFVVPPLFLAVGFTCGFLLTLDIPTGFEEELGEFFFGLCFLLFMFAQLREYPAPATNSPPWFTWPHLSLLAWDRLLLTGLTLLALALRLFQLGSKGLWLPEVIAAYAAQAPTVDLLNHTWRAVTLESPMWPLLLHLWTPLAGFDERALRLLPALAGSLGVPALWLLLKRVYPDHLVLRALASLLLALSPALVFYSQDATGASLLVTLAILALYASVQLVAQPTLWRALAFVTVNWLLTALHLYALTFLLAELLYIGAGLVVARPPAAMGPRTRPNPAFMVVTAAGLALLPALLWIIAAPGFQTALAGARVAHVQGGYSWHEHFGNLWRSLTFGAPIRLPATARAGLGILPFFILGLWVLWSGRERPGGPPPALRLWPLLLTAAIAFPLLPAVFFLQGLPVGALALVIPALLTISALSITYLARTLPITAWASGALIVGVALGGLIYYFGGYQKSDYALMADDLARRARPNEPALFLPPDQHLLATYYLAEHLELQPLPPVPLSAYWPETTTQQVVPEELDGLLQDALRTHPALWLVLADDDAIDPSEFVEHYLTAVAYKEPCVEWVDVEACRFTSPHFLTGGEQTPVASTFGGELQLQAARYLLPEARPQDAPLLYLALDWLATAKPSLDYKVSLRLVDAAGTVVAQHDDFPIGPLLPPTAWQAGDQKPGYVALPLPDALPPGDYRIEATVYDPATGAPVAATRADGSPLAQPFTLGALQVD